MEAAASTAVPAVCPKCRVRNEDGVIKGVLPGSATALPGIAPGIKRYPYVKRDTAKPGLVSEILKPLMQPVPALTRRN